MSVLLNHLAAILEGELALAEVLEDNLARQKQAIVDWDAAALLTALEAREAALNQLAELEAERMGCLADADDLNDRVSLSELLARAPSNDPESVRLKELQTCLRKTFTRLQADERRCQAMINNLSALIDEAWRPLVQAGAPTYGESGAPERPATSLLHSRA